jgi:hypothetical protein
MLLIIILKTLKTLWKITAIVWCIALLILGFNLIQVLLGYRSLSINIIKEKIEK